MCLKTLRISRNLVHALHEVQNLAALPALISLHIDNNPVCHTADFDLFLISHVPTLKAINGIRVGTFTAAKASGESEELERITQKRTDITLQILSLESVLQSAKVELSSSESWLQGVEKSLAAASEFRGKRARIREMLEKADEMRLASSDLQKCIKRCRDEILQKENSLQLLRNCSKPQSLLAPDPALQGKESVVVGELKRLRRDLQGAEKAYDEVLVELQVKMGQIEELERDIRQCESFSENALAADTERTESLPKRREEAAEKVAILKQKVSDLEAKKKELLSEKADLDAIVSRIDDSRLAPRHKKTVSAFPLQPKAQKAADLLQNLYSRITGSDLTITDIDSAVILAVTSALNYFRHKDKELEAVSTEKGRLEKRLEAMESEVNSRKGEVRDEDLRRVATARTEELEKEKVKLEILNENYELQVKRLTEEHSGCKGLKSALESAQSEVDSLLIENERLKNENLSTLEVQVRGIKKQREAAESELREVEAELRSLRSEAKEELAEVQTLRGELEALREQVGTLTTVKRAREEKEEAEQYVRTLAKMMGISPRSEFPDLLAAISSAFSDLQEDLDRAERFHASKAHFLALFESNTAQLTEEWQRVSSAKLELSTVYETEAECVERLREQEDAIEKRVGELNSQAKKLTEFCEDRRKELQRNVREVDELKVAITSLKSESQSLTDTIEQLRTQKSSLSQELESLKSTFASQSSQHQSTSEALRTVCVELADQRKRKGEMETWLEGTKAHVDRLERRREELTQEISALEGKSQVASERLTREERQTRAELESRLRLLDEKKSLISQTDHQLSLIESELSTLRQQRNAAIREHEHAEVDAKEAKSRREELKLEVERLETAATELRERLKAAKGDCEAVKSEKERTKESILTVTMELQALNDLCESAKSDLEGIRTVTESERVHLSTLREECAKAESALTASNSRLSELQRVTDAKQSELAELSRSVELKESLVSDLKLTQEKLKDAGNYEELTRGKATIQTAENQRKAILAEVRRLCSDFEAVECRHKAEVERLETAVEKGRKELQSVVECLDRERDELQRTAMQGERAKRDCRMYTDLVSALQSRLSDCESRLPESSSVHLSTSCRPLDNRRAHSSMSAPSSRLPEGPDPRRYGRFDRK